MYQWLATALDSGIKELDFWNMTFAEVERAIESQNRLLKIQAQERASFDYLLADLIGRSVSRITSSSNTMPDISEVYPTLFDSKEIEQKKSEKKAELSALRFKQFAQSYNSKFKGGGKEK